MTQRTRGIPRAHKSTNLHADGPNWVLIAGAALFSTLSLRLCYKLRQALYKRPQEADRNALKGRGMSSDCRKTACCRSHSSVSSFTQEDEACFPCISGGTGGLMEIRCPSHGQIMLAESDGPLPLVTVPTLEFLKENGHVWSSSSDQLELPPKRFHHSNCLDSPCASESGSDIFSKREVIHKLRQQLKRRDDMILEMQDQIVELQNSVKAQLTNASHLQSRLDEANRELFVSDGEIQRLRKAIAGHWVGLAGLNEKPATAARRPKEARNGDVNGHLVLDENNYVEPEKGRGRSEKEKIEELKRDVEELKEVIQGKQFLVQSYKEQKTELCVKLKELQLRLDSQLPNIL